MISAPSSARAASIATMRLGTLSSLDEESAEALRTAAGRARSYRARRELLVEHQAIAEPLILLGGWAARVRVLQDGRRQIVHLILPGDLIGLCDYEQPIASSTVVALTEITACTAPDAATLPSLRRAYAVSRALEDAYLHGQITRLGRLNAHERIVDLLLELLERLQLAGLVVDGRFAMPVTQEVLADVVGLTSVHVNRTLQMLRRRGEVDWKAGMVTLPAPDGLRRMLGRAVTSVTSAP